MIAILKSKTTEAVLGGVIRVEVIILTLTVGSWIYYAMFN